MKKNELLSTRAALASGALRVYLAAWRDFATWCEQSQQSALPTTSECVGRYIGDAADRGYFVTTIRRRIAARVHVASELGDRCAPGWCAMCSSGLPGRMGDDQKNDPPILALLRDVLAGIEETLQGQRDRALLLLWFVSASRRSELLALNVEDLRWEPGGLVVTPWRSKINQTGYGRDIGIPKVEPIELCHVGVLRTWLDAAGMLHGFFSVRSKGLG